MPDENRIKRRFVLAMTVVIAAVLFCIPAHSAPPAAQRTVTILKIEGVIGQAVKNYIERGIRDSERSEAEAIIIIIDTPGGLMDSMKDICTAMQNTRLPVIVYVWPNGATATSAGFFILMASDIAAMAPDTSTGSSHPVSSQGQMGKVESEKAENYAVSYMKTLVERRGRNFEFAEKAVRHSTSITARDALKENVIEVIAPGTRSLLAKTDGRRVKKNGRVITLHTRGAATVEMGMSPREKFFHTIGHPNIAYILFIVGIYALIFEVTHPGTIISGVIGALCLITAFIAFQVVPIRTLGIFMIAGSFVLFVLEIKIASHGLLSAGGVVLLFLGSLLLIDSPEAALQINRGLIAGVTIGSALFITVALAYIIRSLRSRVTTGEQGMIGLTGTVKVALAPDGKIHVRGELWNAHAENGETLEPGEKVEVTAMTGMTLTVRPAQHKNNS